MTTGIAKTPGGYGYLPGGDHPFSNAVIALAGHAFVRVRLLRPTPLAEGFRLAGDLLRARDRPATAFAACELRSPDPMTLPEFARFNAEYARLLHANGFGAADAYPIARSNLAPRYDPPPTSTLFAFTYAVPEGADPGAGARRDFVISGKPENSADPPGVIAPGDVSPAGLERKAAHVIAAIKHRVAAIGGRWGDVSGVNVYTVQSLDSVIATFAANGLLGCGLTLFASYPPVVGLDFEIDARCVTHERVL